MRRAAIIVLDGLGIGAAPDADRYGDVGSNTLGNVCARRARAPAPEPGAARAGLLRRAGRRSAHRCARCGARRGRARQRGQGQHHRALGALRRRAGGAVPDLSERLSGRSGGAVRRADRSRRDREPRGIRHRHPRRARRRARAHRQLDSSTPRRTASSRWRRTRASCRSSELYRRCRIARGAAAAAARGVAGDRAAVRGNAGCVAAHARTARTSACRRPVPTLLDHVADAHLPRVGVGKVDDLFAGRNISSIHTPTNADAYALIEGALLSMRRGLLLANVIEFDQSWGHRNDVKGFTAGWRSWTAGMPRAAGRGARGGPRYLYRRSRQRPDHAVHRSLARGRAGARRGPAGQAGVDRPPAHLRRRGPDGRGVPRCGAPAGRRLVPARGME